MTQENVEVVQRTAVAVGRRDLATFLEVTDPHVEWHTSLAVISEGGAYHGHDGVRQFVRDLSEAFELFEATIDAVLPVGDLVLAVGRLTYRGKTSGLAESERFGWIFRFQEGKVVYIRAFRDPERVLAAVGLSE
jgi:ketosteroid isomerase-like protein